MSLTAPRIAPERSRERPDLHVVEGPAAEAAKVPQRWYVAAAGAVLILAVLIRATYTLAVDFPLNDGGLFYAMIEDLRQAGFALPAETAYNAAGIPYSYPPLAFYAGAALSSFTLLDTYDVLRVLPLVTSIATVGAFFLLARAMLPDRGQHLAATFVFALLPRSFMWTIMGGGLTRSFGFLFAILTLHQLHAAFVERRPRSMVFATILGALTLLSHIEMAWFLTLSAVLLFAFHGRTWETARWSVASVVGVAVLTSPWWLTNVAYHGLSPFLAAARTGSLFSAETVFTALTFRATQEPMVPVFLFLALAGAWLCITDRRWLLPTWLVLAPIIDPRGFPTIASLPIALLAGIALAAGLGVVHSWFERPHLVDAPRRRLLPVAPAVGWVLVLLTVYASIGSVVATNPTLVALPESERQAMAWIAANTDERSRFLVITAEAWEQDRTSEWFPVLAERISVATVQGTEWLPGGAFGRQTNAYDEVQDCANQTAACIEKWATNSGTRVDYVYISKLVPGVYRELDFEDCCGPLRRDLAADPDYSLVFENDGASIFRAD